MLNNFINCLEEYGNCEFYIRDFDYSNTVFKYVLFIDKNNIIKLKKYWCVYEEQSLKDNKISYLDDPLKYQEYINDDFEANIAEIIVGSTNKDCFCIHNSCLDSENGSILYNIVSKILNCVLGDLEFLDIYYLESIDTVYDHIIKNIRNFFESKGLIENNNPLYVDEIISNFEAYDNISLDDYKKIKKAKTVDQYIKTLNKIK